MNESRFVEQRRAHYKTAFGHYKGISCKLENKTIKITVADMVDILIQLEMGYKKHFSKNKEYARAKCALSFYLVNKMPVSLWESARTGDFGTVYTQLTHSVEIYKNSFKTLNDFKDFREEVISNVFDNMIDFIGKRK